jgi:mannose-6-phosphate isomerase-like protein (cupin superfamily)
MLRPFFLLLLMAFVLGAGNDATSTRNAEHYRWGDCCDGWYLVKNERLNIIEERMPPGTSETRHVHRKAQQFFYVLNGEATLEIDGRTIVLHQREGALVPPGAAHQMQNRSKQDLQIMVTSEPPSHGDREDAPRK